MALASSITENPTAAATPGTIMKCPQCSSEMTSCITVVKSKPSFLSMFAGINGYQHLWFVPVDRSNAAAVREATFHGQGELLQTAYQIGAAYRCAGCKTAVLLGSKEAGSKPS
jgi:hypothetical protein